MRTALLLALALAPACKKSTAPEAPAPTEPPAAEEAPSDTLSQDVVITEDPVTGRLTLSATQTTVGQPVTVQFMKTGLNGCYEQTEVQTTVEDLTWTHRYTTSHEGEVCTANIPVGGFRTTVTPTSPGTWTGRVVVDDEELVTYNLQVGPADEE